VSCVDRPHKPGHCGHCAKKLKGRQKRWCSKTCRWDANANHWFSKAKKRLKSARALYECEECHELTRTIEVNHIVPCKGAHSKWSCSHHIDNLELLCKPCHKLKTDEQRKKGWT